MASVAHRFSTHDDELPLTVPIPRHPGMEWPGDDPDVAHVPVALILAARGQCSCSACCEGFARLIRRSQLRAVS